MSCRRVNRTRLTTLGLRAGVIPATIGLALVGSAGVATAAGGIKPIGISPAGAVVKTAPMAVSVTFAKPLRAGGASLAVIAENGADVGKGAVTTSHQTLRRRLRTGAPGGAYLIRWKAVTKSGHKVHGSFRFTAASGNGPVTAIGPAGQPIPTAAGSSPTEVVATPEPTSTDRAAINATPTDPAAITSTSTGRAASNSTSSGPAVTLTPSGAPSDHASGDSGRTLAAVAPADPGSPRASKDHGLSSGFTLVPLAVGAILVLVAGLIARFNRTPAPPK
jgi:methionine-rich copper-binding protein CopC